MSRLIQIDPEAKLQPEPKGYEFGYHAFENMEPIKCEITAIDAASSKDLITQPGKDIKLPLDDEKLREFQQKDESCKDKKKTNLERGSYKLKILIIKKKGHWKGL